MCGSESMSGMNLAESGTHSLGLVVDLTNVAFALILLAKRKKSDSSNLENTFVRRIDTCRLGLEALV
ncbi:hypothetical protein AGMMS49950_05500 [Endomicrobiia bacterium]|nr:hypothetical protein AGMMS49950_05500 [Endomicrobiia bacterium]